MKGENQRRVRNITARLNRMRQLHCENKSATAVEVKAVQSDIGALLKELRSIDST